MKKGRPCPAPDCREYFQTAHGIESHYQRAHGDAGRWRDGGLMTDGGTAEHPPITTEDDATLRERARALELCIHEERWDRAEDATHHILSEIRKRKGASDD